MKTLISVATFALLVVITGAVLVGAYDVHRDLADVHQLAGTTEQTMITLDLTLAKVNATLATADAAATEERANWKATSLEAAKTGRALRALIDRVDRSLVDGTLEHINTQTLPIIDAQIVANGDRAQQTLTRLGDSAAALTALSTSLDHSINDRMNDPAIRGMLDHWNAISASLVTVAANSADMSGDMKIAVHKLAQPPSKMHTFLDVTWTTLKFGSLFIP